MASTSNRGKNWIESDSLILIDAYQSVMSSKGGTILTFSTVDLLDGESASILNDQIAAQFLASSPVVFSRTVESIKERWIKMVGTYRYQNSRSYSKCFNRHICDFNAGRVAGSTGQASWFTLEKHIQKRSLGKKVPYTSKFLLLN